MKRFFFVILIIALTLCSCDRRPPTVLSERKMVNILFDVHKAEAILSTVNSSTTTIERQEYFETIFKKYHTSKEQFDNSLSWYVSHPKHFMAVYDSLQVKTDMFVDDVLSYHYYEGDISTLPQIDTIDIWMLTRKITFKKDDFHKELDKRNFTFYLNDTAFFDYENKYLFKAQIRAYSKDSVTYKTSLIAKYKSSNDTLICEARADSVLKNYTIQYVARKDEPLKNLNIEMVDSAHNITYFCSENISFVRIYDRTKTTISPTMRETLSRRQDTFKKIW